MVKLLNKIFFHIKNIILPVNMLATIYIIINMFKRLDKTAFGSNFLEFIDIILPFVLLLILWLVNLFLKQNRIQNNTFYNITSLFTVCTIFIFCYRAIFDENMLFWHKYGYKINFNYFSDQIPPIKVMLYGLSIANILMIINNHIKENNINNNKNINNNYNYVYNKNNKNNNYIYNNNKNVNKFNYKKS